MLVVIAVGFDIAANAVEGLCGDFKSVTDKLLSRIAFAILSMNFVLCIGVFKYFARKGGKES